MFVWCVVVVWLCFVCFWVGEVVLVCLGLCGFRCSSGILILDDGWVCFLMGFGYGMMKGWKGGM